MWFGLVYINLIKMCIVTEIELIVRIWSNHQIVVYDILYDYIWYSNVYLFIEALIQIQIHFNCFILTRV